MKAQSDQRTSPIISKWVSAFLLAKKSEGLRPKTLDSYQLKLDGFQHWLLENAAVSSVEEITPDHLRQFLLWLVETKHNPGGQHSFYRVVKAFLKWYEKEEEPANWKNPIAKVKAPKVPEQILEPAKTEDIERLLKTLSQSQLSERDRAIVFTLLDTGIRASELCGLNLSDIDPIVGTLVIRQGKGGKTRSVFLGNKSRKAVRTYLKERGNIEGPLFASRSQERLKYAGLRTIVRRYCVKGDIPIIPLHSFRRAFALSFLRNGGDLLTLQRLMGHSDLSLLKRYAKQTTDDLQRVHSLVSPADRLFT